jgi:hypothetical protein
VFSPLLKIEIGASGREVVPTGAREATVAAVLGEVDAVRLVPGYRRDVLALVTLRDRDHHLMNHLGHHLIVFQIL